MAKTAREQIGVELPEQEPLEQQQVVEEPEAPSRPEWLPENFERPEDLAASYREAQNRIREQGEAQKAFEAQIQQLTQVVENIQQPQQQQQQGVNEQLLAAYENDPIGTVVFLANQVADQKFQALTQERQPQFQAQQRAQGELIANTAQQVLAARFPDWSDYGAKVGEAIDRDPSLMPAHVLDSLDATTLTLERIYKQIKYDDLVKGIANGNNNVDTSRMKQQAQTIGGTVGKPGEMSEIDEKMLRLQAAAKNSSYSAFRGNA